MNKLINFATICIIVAESISPVITTAGVKIDGSPKKMHWLKTVYTPVSNQDIINHFYAFGLEKDKDNPWEYMKQNGFSLDEILKKGRNNNYSGRDLPDEMKKRNGWIYSNNGVFWKEQIATGFFNG